MHIYMPLIILIKLTSSHSTPLTHLISLNSSHLCSYIYFFIFIYPSPLCFFIKLLTCGVIRSYNFFQFFQFSISEIEVYVYNNDLEKRHDCMYAVCSSMRVKQQNKKHIICQEWNPSFQTNVLQKNNGEA